MENFCKLNWILCRCDEGLSTTDFGCCKIKFSFLITCHKLRVMCQWQKRSGITIVIFPIARLAQSSTFELPPWASCLFTECTALLGGRNKPNYLTKLQQGANGSFTGCSSILWLNTQQLSFLINLDPSWVISLYFYPSQRPLAHSPPKRAK